MTVTELIAALQQLDDHDARVFISGYEGGLNDLTDVKPVQVSLGANTDEYSGEHEYREEDDTAPCVSGYLVS